MNCFGFRRGKKITPMYRGSCFIPILRDIFFNDWQKPKERFFKVYFDVQLV